MCALSFQREVTTLIFDELKALASDHFNEVSTLENLTLAPSFDSYQLLENAGILRTYTARDAHGSLEGYAIFIVEFHPHFQTSLQAMNDVIYLSPPVRGQAASFLTH